MTYLNVSNIQHFSTGDGPGIRTTVFLKGCNLRCPWCHNPETVSPKPQELFYGISNKRVTYGRLMTLDEVLDEVLEDEIFYREGGGGVTVSGGEPMLQSEAVAELFKRLKEKGISTLVDTAGDVPWECFERVKEFTDIFYFDVKTGSEEKYSHTVGGDGARIYDNLCRLISDGCTVHARIPLIPDFNTAEEDRREICQRLIAAGVEYVDLLPFHRMGSGKYEALGKEYAYKDVEPQSKNEIAEIAETYKKYFNITIE